MLTVTLEFGASVDAETYLSRDIILHYLKR